MRCGWSLVLAAIVAGACSKHVKESSPAPEPAPSLSASVGRLPVSLGPGPFGFDCSLDVDAGPSSLTPSHMHIEARRLAAPRLVEIPAWGARLPFLEDDLPELAVVDVTPSELRADRMSSAEWVHVYATVAESALPFDACIAHLGQESFSEPTTFTSLTVRVYALEEDLDRVMREASAGAVIGARRIVCEAPLSIPHGGEPFHTRSDAVGAWKRLVLDVPLWYGDYGGVARVEMRARRRPGATVVLMAFYSAAGEGSRDRELERFTKALE
jgi:hypothetical protein